MLLCVVLCNDACYSFAVCIYKQSCKIMIIGRTLCRRLLCLLLSSHDPWVTVHGRNNTIYTCMFYVGAACFWCRSIVAAVYIYRRPSTHSDMEFRVEAMLSRVCWLLAVVTTGLQLAPPLSPFGDDFGSATSPLNVSETTKTVYILSLLPYPDPEGNVVFQPSWDEGPSLYLAAELAVKLINNNSNILNGYTLELLQGDSGCNIISKAGIALLENLYYVDVPVVGIVGPGCSGSAITVSSITGLERSGLLSIHIASALELSDRTKHSFTFGTLTWTQRYLEAVVRLSIRNGWKRLAILYDEKRFRFLSVSRSLIQSVINLFSSSSNVFISSIFNAYIPLDVIQDSKFRIIVLALGPDLLSNVLCLGFYRRFLYPNYQWIIISRTLDEVRPVTFQYDGSLYNCSMNDLNMVLDTSIFVHYNLRPISPNTPTHSQLTYNSFLNLYDTAINNYNLKTGATRSTEASLHLLTLTQCGPWDWLSTTPLMCLTAS